MSINLNNTGVPVHVGDRRRVWARFKDADGAFADPDAFTLTVVEAGGITTSRVKADFTRQSTGEYYCDHTFAQSGRCKVTALASGNIVEAEPGYVLVESL